MTMMVGGNNNNNSGNVVDTTLTKVFVGGLAWETPKEAMRDHFHKYGEILEAVIISDKLTGRSKGYGFVTFKDAEAARKACEDAAPIINGRRANCNLAALGAKRPKSVTNAAVPAATNPPPPPLPPQQGPNIGSRVTVPFAQGNQVQWYYPSRAQAMASPFSHQAIPYYGYTPTYVATTDYNYNHKLGFHGGTYMNGHFPQVYPGQAMIGGNTYMPMYPLYHVQQSHTLGLPAHMFSHAAASPISTTIPPLMSKPTSIPHPNAVCLAVE
ncbi:probable RNA-binding protein ARP1 [Primulina eburnea]|uniref:probable RNA-binding protein ARP1 n=1 Tax=Primulina eburnea TaxID=1245227 RepID=UPI003C6C8598